jgi:hypothetical protein
MSRFEQRRTAGVQTHLDNKKIKYNPNNAIVHLENIGDEGLALQQKNMYWKEGYDAFHSDETGVYMELPRDEAEANAKRYQQDSIDRLNRPAKAGLPEEYAETGNAVALGSKTSGAAFLEADPD